MSATPPALESLIAQADRCARGESVCRRKCKRCDRYREWCAKNDKRAVR